jgi:hypothetical protein
MTQSLSLLSSSGNYSSMPESSSLGSSSRSSKSSSSLSRFSSVPHECMVEMELWHHGLIICQDDLMRHQGFLLRDHLHRAFFVDLLRQGSRGGRGGAAAVGGAVASPLLSASSSSSSSSPMRSSPISLVISISSSS